jgi:hypothetical protein
MDYPECLHNSIGMIDSTSGTKLIRISCCSKHLKRDIKLAGAVFFNNGEKTARKLYFSTNLEPKGEKIVKGLLDYDKIAA